MHALLEQVGGAGVPLAQARSSRAGTRAAWRAWRVNFLPASAAQAAAAMAQTILNGDGAWAWDDDALDMAVNEAPLQHQGKACASTAWCACARPAPARAGGCWTTRAPPTPRANRR